MSGPLRGAKGLKGRAIKEKKTFFGTFFSQRSNDPTAIKLEGGGWLGLNGLAIKRTFFLRLPLAKMYYFVSSYLKNRSITHKSTQHALICPAILFIIYTLVKLHSHILKHKIQT